MSGGLFDRLAGRLDDVAEPEASFAMADLLDLPDDERVVMRHVMRRAETTSIDGLAGELGLDVVDRLQGLSGEFVAAATRRVLEKTEW